MANLFQDDHHHHQQQQQQAFLSRQRTLSSSSTSSHTSSCFQPPPPPTSSSRFSHNQPPPRYSLNQSPLVSQPLPNIDEQSLSPDSPRTPASGTSAGFFQFGITPPASSAYRVCVAVVECKCTYSVVQVYLSCCSPPNASGLLGFLVHQVFSYFRFMNFAFHPDLSVYFSLFLACMYIFSPCNSEAAALPTLGRV